MSLFQVTKKQDIEGYELQTMTGDIVSFTPSYSQLLPDPFSDLNVIVNVLATGGNGTPDNPNPINGYTEANITRCRKNLFDLEKFLTDSGVSYTTDGDWCIFTPTTPLYMTHYKLPISTSKSLLLLIDGSTTATNFRVRVYNNTDSYVATTESGNPSSTTMANKEIGFVGFDWSAVGTVKCKVCIIDGTTAPSTYTPYNGQTYVIAFGQTVYGGQSIITPDRTYFHATWGGVDLGSLNWGIYGGDKFYTTISDLKLPTTTAERATGMLCSIFKPSSNLSVGEMDNYSFLRFNQSENFWVRDTAYSDAATFKTAMNGIKLVYELATPFDIDLTPEVISAVVGENNVFANCGNVTVTCLI